MSEFAGVAEALLRVRREPRWWQGHSTVAVGLIILIVVFSNAPTIAGYVFAPAGVHFMGAPTYAEDSAQHESWASEMSAHVWYQNLLTPEPVPRGWFFHPLEFTLGLAQRATGIPYQLLGSAVALACAPALAFCLMTIARRAGIPCPGFVAAISLLCGSLAPFVHAAAIMGLIKTSAERVRSVGGDATPIFAGPGLNLLLALVVVAALPTGDAEDPARGFRRAGLALFVLAAIYPFFVPTLCVTAALYALVSAKSIGWGAGLRGLVWLFGLAMPGMLYWAVLPALDGEYARFAAENRQPLFSPLVVLVSLGLSTGAIIGIPRLFKTDGYQRMLACFAMASVMMLYVPAHPWRSHIFYLSPVLMIAGAAAWWPLLQRLRTFTRWSIAGVLLIAGGISTPYYYSRNLIGAANVRPPAYVTDGDLEGMRWIAAQPGADVVLARSDLSPWIAARTHHRVVVGHYLWTHAYHRRRVEVEALFAGDADPAPLLRAEHVRWIVIDGERGVPAWARGVEPAARFDQTVVLRAEQVLDRHN